MTKLIFTTFEYEGNCEGQFQWTDLDEIFTLNEKLDLGIDLLNHGNIDKAINKLRRLIKKQPLFIDAYNHIGLCFFKKSNYSIAHRYYQSAYQICHDLIPEEFDGLIEWGQLENRPFLRSLHGIGLCLQKLARTKQTIEIFEKILKYNPNDNQGIRFLIGNLYLYQNEYKLADYFFINHADHYCPYRYSYGLSLFKQKRYVECIEQFWLGFNENIYIAQFILSHRPIISYDIYHASGSDINTACDYYFQNSSLWYLETNSNDELLKKFLNFIFYHESFENRLQEIFKTLHDLNYIRSDSLKNIEHRRELFNKVEEIRDCITIIEAEKIYRDFNILNS